MQYSQLQIWLMAARPKTLWASISPVMIGTAMAFTDGAMHLPSAFAALLGAILIQIGTNLANDYFDYKKGTDQTGRVGPTRVTQAGLVQPPMMKSAMIIVFSLAILVCIYLIKRGGWPIAIIGVLSIISGIFYTAGPYPLGYLGLGEIFVFVFFGPVAVGGTYYVQTLDINPLPIIAGLAPGFLSVAVLVVNNIRDLDSDQKSNKKTLAVRFGRSFAMSEYFLSIVAAAIVPVILCVLTQDYKYSLLASLSVAFALPSIKTVFTKSDGPSLNHALAYTGKLLFLYGILFSVGWIL